MKCAYSAGILDRFLDEKIRFSYVIGVSAGAANGASFVAGQRDRNRRFYTTHIGEKGYFGLRSFIKTGDLFGLDYIYSDLTNTDGGDPLDYDRIMSSPTEYELVTTNARTGKAEYFSKQDLEKNNYQLIKASCCLPAACRPREYKGNFFYDGGLSDPIPAEHALAKGCDKVVVILSKPRDFVMQPQKMRIFYHVACRNFPRTVSMIEGRHISYMDHFRKIFELEKEGKAFVFAPSRHLPMGTYRMNADQNQALYNLGISDFENRVEELRLFMGNRRTLRQEVKDVLL